jgi:hypothetical protein
MLVLWSCGGQPADNGERGPGRGRVGIPGDDGPVGGTATGAGSWGGSVEGAGRIPWQSLYGGTAGGGNSGWVGQITGGPAWGSGLNLGGLGTGGTGGTDGTGGTGGKPGTGGTGGIGGTGGTGGRPGEPKLPGPPTLGHGGTTDTGTGGTTDTGTGGTTSDPTMPAPQPPTSDPVVICGTMIGNGTAVDGTSTPSSFNYDLHLQCSLATTGNRLEISWQDNGQEMTFRLDTLTEVSCSDTGTQNGNTAAGFDTLAGQGTGTLTSGCASQDGYTIELRLVDDGSPQHGDAMQLTIRDGEGTVVFSFDGGVEDAQLQAEPGCTGQN